MRLKSRIIWLKNTTKCLSLLVLWGALCYPANVCAHLQPEALVDSSIAQVENLARITIKLTEVSELDKVARFTQLLAKNRQLSNLRLTQVQLEADHPQRSFVRWSAQIASGTPDDLEQGLQSAAAEFDEGFKVVHRQSYRGFVAFALHTIAQNDNDGNDLPTVDRSTWSIHPGHGFD